MIQKTFSEFYNTKPIQRYIKWAGKEEKIAENGKERIKLPNYEKLQDYVPIGMMAWLSLIQCGFFAKSKEMPTDKKATLISNEIYTAGLGVAISLLSLKGIKTLTKKFENQAEKVLKDHPHNKAIINGIKTAIPAAFAITFCQYLAPIATTPLATMTTKYLIKKGMIKDPSQRDKLNVKG